MQYLITVVRASKNFIIIADFNGVGRKVRKNEFAVVSKFRSYKPVGGKYGKFYPKMQWLIEMDEKVVRNYGIRSMPALNGEDLTDYRVSNLIKDGYKKVV